MRNDWTVKNNRAAQGDGLSVNIESWQKTTPEWHLENIYHEHKMSKICHNKCR